MKKNLINVSMLCALCTGAVTYAQQGKVGINTENPKATLDLKISNVNVNGNSKEGIIIPNVTSARAKNMGEDVEESTLVYITDGTTGTGTTSLVDGKGFYYFDATQKKWVKVDKKYTAGSGITINGNTISANVTGGTTYNSSTSVKVNGNTMERAALSGDVTAAQNSNTTKVVAIQGKAISNATPTAGQVLKWNGNQWAPAADTDTNTTYSGSTSVVLEGTTFKRAALTGDAVADKDSNEVTVRRLQGKFISATAPTGGQVLKWNAQQNQWIPAADTDTKYRAGNGITINNNNVISTNLRAGNGITISGNTISSNVTGGTTYTSSESVKVNGTTMERAALTGDVTAAQNNNTTKVVAIQGKAISTTAPTNGQVLKWNGNQWAPAADTDTKYRAGNGISISNNVISTNLRAGSGITINGNTISANVTGGTTYTSSESVKVSGNTMQRAALTGDVTAAQNNNNVKVTKLQGRAISNTNPSNGQVLKWNGNQWAPAADNGSTYTAGQGMNLGGPGHSANEFWRTGLEEISGNNGNKGLAIIGRTADNYGKIGEKAVDLSYSNSASTTRGATGNYSVAMGRNTTASSQDATAMGFQTTASGRYSTAMGLNTIASGQSSTAMGDRANASNKNAIAMGNNATASGENSVAIGDSSNASQPHAIAIGRNTKALGPDAMAIGALTTASGNNSTAIGTNTTATGDYSIAIGRASTASGTEAITLGGGTTSSGDYSTTMGQRTTASGNHAVAMGLNTTASGPKSVSMGVATVASGENAVVMGNNSAASGTGAVAMGLNTTASGDYSVAMGIINTASGYGEVVIGNRATPSTVNLRDRVNPPRSRLFTIGNGDAFNGNLHSDAFTVLHNARVGINIDHFEKIIEGSAKLVVNGAIQLYRGGDEDHHWSASDPAASMSCSDESNEGSIRYIRTGTESNARGVFQGCRYTGSGYRWEDLHNR